jgi:hypothetical protein
MEKKLNAVEFAIKVTSFRKLVRDICRKKALEYPSDEKIAEWIEQGYGMENIDDFIKDYTEKEGIFREPITDFINEVNKISWFKKPTEDEIKEFFEKRLTRKGLSDWWKATKFNFEVWRLIRKDRREWRKNHGKKQV